MKLVEAVRDGKSYEEITRQLAEASPEELKEDLNTEAKQKAFWLNVYNA